MSMMQGEVYFYGTVTLLQKNWGVKMDLQSMKDLFHARLDRIVRLAKKLPENHPHGIIERFRLDFVRGGDLENLKFDQCYEPFPDQKYKKISDRPRMHISSDATECFFRVSQQLLGMFQNLESTLGRDALESAIDSFLVHEIVHRHQGMGEGNHRNLSTLGPGVLAVLDYEADACSALILFAFMMAEEYEINGNSGWMSQEGAREKWACFAKCIRSNILQIYVFSLFDYQKGSVIDARKAAFRNTGVARWERVCAWHMQYHRALRFSIRHPISSMQLLSRPAIAFRNQEYAYAQKKLNAYWPAYEHKKSTSKSRRARVSNKKKISKANRAYVG